MGIEIEGRFAKIEGDAKDDNKDFCNVILMFIDANFHQSLQKMAPSNI